MTTASERLSSAKRTTTSRTEMDPRRAAVAARDARFDGKFVFAVKTTGVYCRPTCPARQAKPENVIFYDGCDQAERGGFRACKRCRPAPASPAAITFAVADCALGAMLVAASTKGICAIFLGDDAEELARDLKDRFPNAELKAGNAAFGELVARVTRLVEAPRSEFDLPLDMRGTMFQERVWRALRAIPAGRTLTYADVARRIGDPKAVRAVAKACAANAIAVAIPCHRVVRSDGALAGYRWGVTRKRALLSKEAQA
jgi:AraC family transcriptional regulator of adaptative response/methylated-DNA-[protein]-cysteine methyltransferase